jgi:hypothetical protein
MGVVLSSLGVSEEGKQICLSEFMAPNFRPRFKSFIDRVDDRESLSARPSLLNVVISYFALLIRLKKASDTVCRCVMQSVSTPG